MTATSLRKSILHASRIAIEDVSPAVDSGRFNVKRLQGESVTVEADIFMDTHDKIKVSLAWKFANDMLWNFTPMYFAGNDRWQAEFPLNHIGQYWFKIEAWHDKFGTYRDGLIKKVSAAIDVHLEIEEGRILLQQAARNKKEIPNTLKPLLPELIHDLHLSNDLPLNSSTLSREVTQAISTGTAAALSDKLQHYSEIERTKLSILLSDLTNSIMEELDPQDFLVASNQYPNVAERKAAVFSSWYEMFPRSQSGSNRHGTFDDVVKRLPEINAMGFDTLYFTPIHPIGRKDRKGRNNSLVAASDDPGSPYAIGSEDGGHDTIHHELGDWNSFRNLQKEAAQLGIEIALDFAIQCAPDHPWVKQHPEWFDWRPDGTIKHAENPPKKYQDIVNVDFYLPKAIPNLWIALRDVVLLWVREGIRTFRVDNPHTKPLPFWEWLIKQVQDQCPDVIFLSEAFTTPKMMNRLSKIGFTQSYTYFTWRNTKQELTDYITEVCNNKVNEFFRPHFFANTPDIHPYYLQQSGRAGFLIRAALASTMSGLWGISSGFELCEADALPEKEEFNHSEKYEIRSWDWQRPGNIIAEISMLNRLRKLYPVLQTHLGITFHPADNQHILLYSKTGERKQTKPVKSLILVAVNLDPHNAQEANMEIPLYMLGLSDHATVSVRDIVNDVPFEWHAKWHHIRVDPYYMPFAIWHLYVEEN